MIVVATITLETIYKELLELKKKVERLELLLTLPEEELPDSEIWELQQISKQMAEGEKTLWKKTWGFNNGMYSIYISN